MDSKLAAGIVARILDLEERIEWAEGDIQSAAIRLDGAARNNEIDVLGETAWQTGGRVEELMRNLNAHAKTVAENKAKLTDLYRTKLSLETLLENAGVADQLIDRDSKLRTVAK